MDTFAEDFLIELEAHVRGTAPRAPVQKSWNPGAVAAPERHFAAGAARGLPFSAMSHQLERQETFERLLAMLPLSWNTECRKANVVDATLIDAEKEQVWLFGFRWFSIYFEELLEPSTMRSAFYCKNHMAFLGLLTEMCAIAPSVRPTFRAALESWDAEAAAAVTPCQTAAPSAAAVALPSPASATAPVSASATAPVSASATAPVPVSVPVSVSASATVSPPPGGTRLVLKQSVKFGGHNKTRRSHCS